MPSEFLKIIISLSGESYENVKGEEHPPNNVIISIQNEKSCFGIIQNVADFFGRWQGNMILTSPEFIEFTTKCAILRI
jgi:hypothetical protein